MNETSLLFNLCSRLHSAQHRVVRPLPLSVQAGTSERGGSGRLPVPSGGDPQLETAQSKRSGHRRRKTRLGCLHRFRMLNPFQTTKI